MMLKKNCHVFRQNYNIITQGKRKCHCFGKMCIIYVCSLSLAYFVKLIDELYVYICTIVVIVNYNLI